MSKPSNTNRYRKPALTHTELMNLLSMRTHLSTKTVTRVYIALIEYIIEDLKSNGKTRLQWLGIFYSRMTEGGVKNVPQPDGTMVEKYCTPKRKAYFVPAVTFEENLNEDLGVNSLKQAREKYKKGQLITASSPLKIEREQAVKAIIEQEALNRKMGYDDDEIEIDEEDLTLDALYDDYEEEE